jgi:hypothetical protein
MLSSLICETGSSRGVRSLEGWFKIVATRNSSPDVVVLSATRREDCAGLLDLPRFAPVPVPGTGCERGCNTPCRLLDVLQ